MHDLTMKNSYDEDVGLAARRSGPVLTEGRGDGPYYEYRHVVDLEETDHAGNPYRVNLLRWQGRCREMFLLEYLPSLLDGVRANLMLATVESGCEYLTGIQAFDEISIRMRLNELTSTQISLVFECVRLHEGDEELVAQGWQQVICISGGSEAITPVQVPKGLRSALESYAVRGPRRTGSIRPGTRGVA
jgi:enediyne core biosynthesis thioesterase